MIPARRPWWLWVGLAVGAASWCLLYLVPWFAPSAHNGNLLELRPDALATLAGFGLTVGWGVVCGQQRERPLRVAFQAGLAGAVVFVLAGLLAVVLADGVTFGHVGWKIPFGVVAALVAALPLALFFLAVFGVGVLVGSGLRFLRTLRGPGPGTASVERS